VLCAVAPWVADEKTANLQGLLFSFFKTFLLLFPAYLDRTAILQYDKARNQNHPKYYILSFDEIHISQAQVSRLEKGALEHIRKQI
ncbi:MAG: hypothetical protein U0N17_09525, partial [Agathobaculum butyriciproducens]